MDKETLELAKQIYIANCASGMEPGKAIKKAKAFLRKAKGEWQIKPLEAPEEACQDRGASDIDPGVPGASGAVCEPKAEQAHFYLSPKKWDDFIAALDAPPKDLPNLRKLLTEPSVLDEGRIWDA